MDADGSSHPNSEAPLRAAGSTEASTVVVDYEVAATDSEAVARKLAELRPPRNSTR